MKRLLVILMMLLATVASGQQSIQTGPLQSGSPGFAFDLTSANAAGVYYIGPAAIVNAVEFELGVAFAGELYTCPVISADLDRNGTVDTAAKCTLVTALTADVRVTTSTLSRFLVLDINTAESAGNTSYLTLRGAVSLSRHEATQSIPSVATETRATFAEITNPAAVSYGYGVSFSKPDIFNDALKYPGGPAGLEANNQAGYFYNLLGVQSATLVSNYEHAFNASWENSYRQAATGHKTWAEYNIDVTPPVHSAPVTGATGNFSANDWISFSGGGSGRVKTYSAGTLVWTQNYGTTASGQTITNITQAGTGTLGTNTFVGHTYDLRPLQLEWDSVDNVARWEFKTDFGAAISTLRMRDGKVGVNSLTSLESYMQAESRDTISALQAGYVSNGVTSNGNVTTGVIKLDLAAAAASADSHADVTSLRFQTVTQPGAGALAAFAVTRSAAIEIRDQKGFASTDSSAIRIDPQTVTGVGPAGAQGNFTMRGGNWNNGHYVLGGYGYNTSGDHLFFDQTNNLLRIKVNTPPTSETDGVAVVTTVVSGIKALATGVITAGTCATDTQAAPGVLSTDVVSWNPNTDLSAVVGYRPFSPDGLSIYPPIPSTNLITFKACNPTASSITPGAVTLNYRVDR